MFESEFQTYLISHGLTLEYIDTLSFWIRWCKLTKTNILAPTYTDVMEFVSYNVQTDISNGTINNRLKAVRKYYVFLSEIGKVPLTVVDEVNKFKNLRTETKVKNVFDKTEFARIVGSVMYATRRQPWAFKEIKAKQRRAVLFFMFYTGTRISEVVNLHRKDIDLVKSSAVIRVPVKNKSERYVYFPGGDVSGITKYLKDYFDSDPEVINAFNMSAWQIRRLVTKINEFLPAGKQISPHTLRHCFGNMLAEGNVNVRVAQKLLGHKNINSTMIYYDPDQKTVEKIYREHVQPVEVIKPTKEVVNDAV